MSRPKIEKGKKHINSRIDDYLYNIILKNQEEMGYATFTESLIEFICGGVNYKYFIEKENEDDN